MLKKRIIPIQLLLNGRLVKSKQFDAFRDVGDPVKSASVYNSQYADELIFLNIHRQANDTALLLALIEQISRVCFMPLSIGGGIRTFEQAAQLIKNGADKVVLNSICYTDQSVITKVANEFGSQAVIVAIDVRKKDGSYQLFSHSGQILESVLLDQHIQNILQAGAGELLIQSIDRDGTMTGFDIDLMKYVATRSSVPMIACGGSGNYDHLKEVFIESDVSAVACGSIFNFSDSNLIRAKAYLSNYNLPFKVV